ncbi:unnamed protein product [Cylicocyclus nassatus]|uniref:Uncharacterized protein n=1 Tax=Cylicocyclus nassatus TaxID=53992 RepID=A0AA36GR64_CYLNA|nr:unnamed protein product [Cylicocyclus nassatus]
MTIEREIDLSSKARHTSLSVLTDSADPAEHFCVQIRHNSTIAIEMGILTENCSAVRVPENSHVGQGSANQSRNFVARQFKSIENIN